MTLSFIPMTWIAAAVVNSTLAVSILVYLRIKRQPISNVSALKFFSKYRLSEYYPTAAVIMFILIAVAISTGVGDGAKSSVAGRQIAWVLWIPIIEEIVFRVGIGNWFRSRAGRIWGSYFSVFVFAFVHSHPTVDRILSGDVGVPLGPLLLAVACEIIYVGSGKIWPAMTLHAVCNGSVIAFSLLDARWLAWLDFLYQ